MLIHAYITKAIIVWRGKNYIVQEFYKSSFTGANGKQILEIEMTLKEVPKYVY